MNLHVTSSFAFFTHGEIKKNEDVKINTGEICEKIIINGIQYVPSNGCVVIPRGNLIGHNLVSVVAEGRTIPCEAIRSAAGYSIPAGITEKEFIFELEKCVESLRREKEMILKRANKLAKYAPKEDDLFDF